MYVYRCYRLRHTPLARSPGNWSNVQSMKVVGTCLVVTPGRAAICRAAPCRLPDWFASRSWTSIHKTFSLGKHLFHKFPTSTQGTLEPDLFLLSHICAWPILTAITLHPTKSPVLCPTLQITALCRAVTRSAHGNERELATKYGNWIPSHKQLSVWLTLVYASSTASTTTPSQHAFERRVDEIKPSKRYV